MQTQEIPLRYGSTTRSSKNKVTQLKFSVCCFSQGVNSALVTFFFGPGMDQKLTIEKFLEFQQQLQREILSLEVSFQNFSIETLLSKPSNRFYVFVFKFQRKNPDENGKISETDFTELLLAYAGYPQKKKARMLKRVKKA